MEKDRNPWLLCFRFIIAGFSFIESRPYLPSCNSHSKKKLFEVKTKMWRQEVITNLATAERKCSYKFAV